MLYLDDILDEGSMRKLELLRSQQCWTLRLHPYSVYHQFPQQVWILVYGVSDISIFKFKPIC